MREFFGSAKFKIFAIIACVLIGLMLRTAVTGGLPTLTQNVASTVMGPFQKASSYVSSAFSGLITNISQLGSLKSENESLKKQIGKLQSQIVDYNEIKQQNEQLRGLVDINQDSYNAKYTPAKVIARDPNQWFSSFTIDKGTLNGIKKGDPVITSEGLVGIIVTPNYTTSVVSTLLDPSVHVGGIVSQTGDTGITHGERELASKGEFTLAYLSPASSVTAGNIVVTPGSGGMFPKDLKIGIVQELKPDISGNSKNAVLKPLVDPSSVKSVFVITDFTGKQGETVVPKASAAASSSKGGKK